ncbi:MAG: hypothetical protein JWM41_249 [Gemmatimonadetes bacterium]|nr:hypothetical protein [Gemmatimonadota bacterium]
MTSAPQRVVQIGLNVLAVATVVLGAENWYQHVPSFIPLVFTAITGLSAAFAALAWYAITQLDKLSQDIDTFGFGLTQRAFEYIHGRRNRVLYAGIACTIALATNAAVAAIMASAARYSLAYKYCFVLGAAATAIASLAAVRIVTVHSKLQTFRRDLLSRLFAQKKAAEVIRNIRASDVLSDVSTAPATQLLPHRN